MCTQGVYIFYWYLGLSSKHDIVITRNVTVCHKCPRRPLIMTLIPGCDLEHSQGTSLAQDISCHFVLLFCVTLTLAKNLNFDYDMFTFS